MRMHDALAFVACKLFRLLDTLQRPLAQWAASRRSPRRLSDNPRHVERIHTRTIVRRPALGQRGRAPSSSLNRFPSVPAVAAATAAAACVLLSACASIHQDAQMVDPSGFMQKSRGPMRLDPWQIGPSAPPPGATMPFIGTPALSATVTACFATKQADSTTVVADVATRRTTEALLGQALVHGSVSLHAWIGPFPGSGGPGSTATGGWFDDTNLDTEDKRFLATRYGSVVMAASKIDGWFFKSSDAICAAELTARVPDKEGERICIAGGTGGLECRLACDATGCREAALEPRK